MWPAGELGCGRVLFPTQRGLASSSCCNAAGFLALESLSSAFAVESLRAPRHQLPCSLAVLCTWIKGRYEVIDIAKKELLPSMFHQPTTGLNEVHYTWAGTFVLEALCIVYPTINFALMDSDCVPTALFEIADLVTLIIDQVSREEAMQSYTTVRRQYY